MEQNLTIKIKPQGDQLSFASVEEAAKALKLDRRRKYGVVVGELYTPGKYLMDCTGCNGHGCRDCGGKKKVYTYYPEFIIRNGLPIKIDNGTGN